MYAGGLYCAFDAAQDVRATNNIPSSGRIVRLT
jgi:hypothetical protein